jgi:unconventional prefoldin RPB5 interactor 1
MAGTIKDSFLDLERHRQLLEENIKHLRKSLRHWQTWEAEYEGLKEEILAADPPPNRAQLITLTHAYEGDLVNRKDVDEILGPDSRSAAQVVNILDRRLDYVEQNVRTVQKQVEVAEEKLAAATIISTPDVRNEEGLPLTEIVEELDEEGNVISSHTSTPGSAKPQLLEVLKKAGVKDLPSLESSSNSSGLHTIPEKKEVDHQKTSEHKDADQKDVSTDSKASKTIKKGVKFAEDTKSGPEPEKSRTAKRVEEIMSIAKRSEERSAEPAIVPTDESPEDAKLRREMLQYSMSEVGAVVAELNLEDGSDWSDEDYDDGTSTDDEDQFGRSIGSIVNNDLRQRMLELEQRLGARVMENAGNNTIEPGIVREGIGRVTVNGQDTLPADDTNEIGDTRNDSASPNTKKIVRFSEDLDISPASSDGLPSTSTSKSTVSPISDVVERTAPAEPLITSPQKKTSRFKSDRRSAPKVLNGPYSARISGPSLPLQPLQPSKPKPFSQPIEFPRPEEHIRMAPTGPEGKTLASTIVERDVSLEGSAAEPDELDSQLLHQEVATEYHRIRNQMIQRQGGFVKEEENEIVPFTEEEGGPKKVSRFKAARLARS